MSMKNIFPNEEQRIDTLMMQMKNLLVSWVKTYSSTEASLGVFFHRDIQKAHFFGILIDNDLNLTIREIQILYLIFINKKQKDIMQDFKISKNTLKTHMKNIYRKMDVANLQECKHKLETILHIYIKNIYREMDVTDLEEQ